MSEGEGAEGASSTDSACSSSSNTGCCSRDSSESPSSSVPPNSVAGSELEPAIEVGLEPGRPLASRGIRDLRWVLVGFATLRKGCLYLFLFVSSLLEAEGLPKKDMREPIFWTSLLRTSSMYRYCCLPCWRWGSWYVSRVTADEYRNVRFGGWLYHLAWSRCYVRLWPHPAPSYSLFTMWLCRVDSYDKCYKDRYQTAWASTHLRLRRILPCRKRCSVNGWVGIRPLPLWCACLPRHLGTETHGSGSKVPWAGTHARRPPHPAPSSPIVFRVERDVGAVVAWCTGPRSGSRLWAGCEGVAAHPGGSSAVVVLTVIHRGTDVHPQTTFGLLLDLVEREDKWCSRNISICYLGSNSHSANEGPSIRLTWIRGQEYSSKNTHKQKKLKTKGQN